MSGDSGASSGKKELGIGGWILCAALLAYAAHLADNARNSFPRSIAPTPSPSVVTHHVAPNEVSTGCPPALKAGDSGRNVVVLQYTLTENGAVLDIDGDYGPGTVTAVKNFQSAHGLPADGITGKQTWKTLGLC